MNIAIFLLLSIIWGTTWVAIKISLEAIPPFWGATLRFSVAVVALFFYQQLKNHRFKIPVSDFKVIFLSAILMYGFDYGLIYWGEQYLSAGVTSIFFATFPIFTALWSNFIFRNEKFSWNVFGGLLLGFIGIMVVFYDQLIRTNYNLMVLWGVVAVVVGAIGGAASVVLVKKYLKDVEASLLTFHQMLIGVITLLIMAIIFESPQQIQFGVHSFLAVVYLGVVGSALAFVLYYWILKKISAITMSLIIYITPIVALFSDFLWYGETVNVRILSGMLTVFAGIALNQKDYILRAFLKNKKVESI